VSRYFHPEFGYFCPTPLLRRELRVACSAGLFGVVLGTIGVIALNRIEGAVNLASLVSVAATQPGAEGVAPRRLANTKHNDLRKPTAGGAAQGAAYESTRQSTAQSPKRGQEAAAPGLREFGSAGATKARLHARWTKVPSLHPRRRAPRVLRLSPRAPARPPRMQSLRGVSRHRAGHRSSSRSRCESPRVTAVPLKMPSAHTRAIPHLPAPFSGIGRGDSPVNRAKAAAIG